MDMKNLTKLQGAIPFRGDENYTQDVRDEKGQFIKDPVTGKNANEDVRFRDILVRAVYEYTPPAAARKILLGISKLSDKLESSVNEIELSDDEHGLLLLAVEQLAQPVQSLNRPPLFRAPMIGSILAILEGQKETRPAKQDQPKEAPAA